MPADSARPPIAPGIVPGISEIAQIEGLLLRARTVVEGAFAGIHRSPHRGQSVEFAEHKEYALGDEIRHIDWKAVARIDRLYVKRFEEETDLGAYLVVDASASMSYGASETRLSKYRYAATMATALAFILLKQQDRVGLVLLGERPQYLPPRGQGSQLYELVEMLEHTEPTGKTDLVAGAEFLAERLRRRSVVVILSDLLDWQSGALDGLRRLRAMRHDLVAFQLLDPDELQFPFEEPTKFEGMEDSSQVLCDPRAMREEYLGRLRAFLGNVRSTLLEADVEYRLVDTSQSPSEVLATFVGERLRVRPRK